jgi:hypothetical protein
MKGRGKGERERIGEHLGPLSRLRRALVRPRLHQQRVLRVVGSAVHLQPAASWEGPSPEVDGVFARPMPLSAQVTRRAKGSAGP